MYFINQLYCIICFGRLSVSQGEYLKGACRLEADFRLLRERAQYGDVLFARSLKFSLFIEKFRIRPAVKSANSAFFVCLAGQVNGVRYYVTPHMKSKERRDERREERDASLRAESF